MIKNQENKMTKLELLEQKPWYRLIKVLAFVWVILSFFAGFYLAGGITGGLFNVVIWVILFVILKQVIVYVVFGKSVENLAVSDTNEEISDELLENSKTKEENTNNGVTQSSDASSEDLKGSPLIFGIVLGILILSFFFFFM